MPRAPNRTNLFMKQIAMSLTYHPLPFFPQLLKEKMQSRKENMKLSPFVSLQNQLLKKSRKSSLNIKKWILPSSSTYYINSICIWNLKKGWWMVTRWKSLRFKCAWILQLLYSWKLSLLIVAVIHCKTYQKVKVTKPGNTLNGTQ